jgi:hypothetical protein
MTIMFSFLCNMYSKIFRILIVKLLTLLLIIPEMRSQDYQRMSKSELREGIMKISGNLDSVIFLNQNLMRRVFMLERDLEDK